MIFLYFLYLVFWSLINCFAKKLTINDSSYLMAVMGMIDQCFTWTSFFYSIPVLCIKQGNILNRLHASFLERDLRGISRLKLFWWHFRSCVLGVAWSKQVFLKFCLGSCLCRVLFFYCHGSRDGRFLFSFPSSIKQHRTMHEKKKKMEKIRKIG